MTTIHTIHARVVDELEQVHLATFALSDIALEPEFITVSVPYAVSLLTRQVTQSSGRPARELLWEVHRFGLSV
jgi:hypothetical protein